MSETSNSSSPKMSEDLRNATGSPGLQSGLTLFDLQDGKIPDPAGPEAAPVQVSRVRAKGQGLMTLVTSGRTGIPSSASVALERFLVNSLMTRLDTAGSTLFRETWKRRATPLRRPYWEHTASVRRTSGSDCTSVPTPKQPKYGHDQAKFIREPGRKAPTDLETAVSLATVPTPMAGSPATETYNAAGNNDYSRKIVELASVSTPRRTDPKSGHSYTENMTGCSLPMDANLASVPTPNTMDVIDRKNLRPSRIATNRKSGYLAEVLATVATPSASKSRPRSSKPQGK